MANHLTPTELADEVDMKRQEVIARCVQMGIPILHGRIDKTLFLTSLRQLGLSFPAVTPEEQARFDELRRQLETE